MRDSTPHGSTPRDSTPRDSTPRGSASSSLGAQIAERAHLGPAERRSVVRLGAAALITHGLVHAMGLTLLWRWDDASNLRYNDHPAPGSALGIAAGWICLLAGALFVVAGILVLAGRRAWRTLAVIAVLLSVPVLIPFANAALAGLVVDVGVLVAVFATRGTRPTLATRPPS